MVKIGFIVEGDSEKYLVQSAKFKEFLKQKNIDCVDFIANAEGSGNLLPHRLSEFTNVLKEEGATHILILTDLECNPNIDSVLKRISAPENHIVVVSVKAIEAWYLADSPLLTSIFKKNYHYPRPEETPGMPIDTLKQEFIIHTGRGFSRSKPRLAQRMIATGFSFVNSAQHENCPSAKYFLSKILEIAKQ